jgi:hypothetical protein
MKWTSMKTLSTSRLFSANTVLTVAMVGALLLSPFGIAQAKKSSRIKHSHAHSQRFKHAKHGKNTKGSRLKTPVLFSKLPSQYSRLPLPDLTTTAGFYATCNAMGSVPLFTPNNMASLTKTQLQAWVVCKDVALVQQSIGWINKALVDNREAANNTAAGAVNWSNPREANNALQAQLTYMQRELASGRAVLKYLSEQPLNALDALHVRPQTWRLDLDGNGEVSPWENLFFALPKRGGAYEPFELRMPSDAGVDLTAVQSEAFIKTDATDVLWALSHHELLEGVVEMLRSQYIDINALRMGGGLKQLFTLQNKAAWTRAYDLINNSLATSLAMRQSALAETDNDYEWLPNPKQTNSAFPISLDMGDYTTWTTMVSELQALWQGKTLLVMNEYTQDWLQDLSILGRNDGTPAFACPEDMALDIKKLFTAAPPEHLFSLDIPEEACSIVTPNHPASKLPALAAERADAGKMDTRFLRYFYWVN